MSELSGVLTFICVMAWLSLAGYAFAKMADGAETKDGAIYFWACLLLAPMMAAACLVAPPTPKNKTGNHETK